MRKFLIKVNGKAYDVEVEEQGASFVQAPVPAAVVPAVAEPVQAAPEKIDVPTGSSEIKAPMPGNIIDILVAKGDKVKQGDVLVILEAMKMENEIKSPVSGTVAAVAVAKGASVNSGDLLIAIQ